MLQGHTVSHGPGKNRMGLIPLYQDVIGRWNAFSINLPSIIFIESLSCAGYFVKCTNTTWHWKPKSHSWIRRTSTLPSYKKLGSWLFWIYVVPACILSIKGNMNLLKFSTDTFFERGRVGKELFSSLCLKSHLVYASFRALIAVRDGNPTQSGLSLRRNLLVT